MADYLYYKDSGVIKRVYVEPEMDPFDPREWDGNVGTMACWYKGYDLGDKIEKKDPEEYINSLVEKNVSDRTLINYVRKGKASNGLELIYDRKEKEYQLMGDYRVWWNGDKIHHGELASQPCLNWIVEDIIESLPISDKIALLEKKGFYFLPLAVYEHSGITMWVGSRDDHFDSQWDCSNVGWIYTTKKAILDCGCRIKNKKGDYRIKVTDRNWKIAAKEQLEAEVEIYDQYLTGEVYVAKVDTLEDPDDTEDGWLPEDSIGSWYSKKYGTDLIREVASEFTSNELFDDLEKVA